MNVNYLTLLLFLLCCEYSVAQDLVLNEMMSINKAVLADEVGDYSDWIELYNKSEEPINLGNYFLTDDIAIPAKWRLPNEVIGPAGFQVVFASGKDVVFTDFWHTNFSIKGAGEALFLFDEQGSLVHELPAVQLGDDQSFGMTNDGNGITELLYFPTPGYSNSNHQVYFSESSGMYESALLVELSASDTDSIYYTTDGSIPTMNSILYTGPIAIDQTAAGESEIAFIPTTAIPNTDYHDWKNPLESPFQFTVIRAASFKNNTINSQIFTHSYLFGNGIGDRYTLPIVSLAVDPSALFDYDTGIFVPGVHLDPSDPNWTGNYSERGSDWEREASLEYFDVDGQLKLKQDIGIRVHGFKTRSVPQKSIRLYAREDYGWKEMGFPFFEDIPLTSYKRAVLRSSYCAWGNSMVKDELAAAVFQDLNVDYSESNPVVVFINGVYWGVYSLRERMDQHYFAAHYDIASDSINLMESYSTMIHGETDANTILRDFINNNDMALSENYEHVKTLMDVAGFIDYQITQLFFNNRDLHGGNFKYWHSDAYDGKIRWQFFDLDGGFDFPEDNTYEKFTGALWIYDYFRELLKNKEFESQFYSRFNELLQTTLLPQNIQLKLVDITDRYRPELEEHIKRWPFIDSLEEWEDKVKVIEDFLFERSRFMSELLLSLEVETQFKLFPNPNAGVFSFVSSDPLTDVSIVLVDISGRVIYREHFEEVADAIRFDLPNLQRGIYIVNLYQNGNVLQSKVVVN